MEWLVEPEQLIEVLSPASLDLDGTSAQVCVLGCGRSRLSMLLLNMYKSVVSIDNDPAVIAEMSLQHQDLEWREADVTKPFAPPGTYDLCVDKSTLDAIMCSNVHVVNLLSEVHAALADNGIYFIVSLHPTSFLQSFLSVPGLGFEVMVSLSPPRPELLVAYILRRCGKQTSRDAILKHQLAIMDIHFRQQNSMLTPQRRVDVAQAFGCRHSLTLREAYCALFTDLERSEYSFEYFLSDASTMYEREDRMSLDQAFAFLEKMQ